MSNFSVGPFGSPDPSLNLRVSDVQRDRVVDFLQRAFADGRIDRMEFDRRLDAALSATVRADLDAAYKGVPGPTLAADAVATPASRQPTQAGNASSGLTHWLSIPFPIVAGGVSYLSSPTNSSRRVEAAKSVNFNLTWIGLVIALGVVGQWVSLVHPVTALAALIWFFGNLIAGFRAANGDDAPMPLSRFINVQVLNPGKGPRQIGR